MLSRGTSLSLRLCAAILISGLFVPLPAIAATARGVVFHDLDGDGMRDSNEPGLPNVGISNGREIVRTVESGDYRIPIDGDAILFVLKPRGWRTPIDENQIPRFYFIHKPKGSPPSKYSGVEPTGSLPKSIDFPLTPQNEPERFEVILFGDTQPRNQREIDFLAHDVIEQLIGADAAFGVTLGDIVFDDLSLYGSLNRTIALIGIPWYNVIGNHDINFDAPEDQLSDETFERNYGPSYYSFDYGPVHFIVLDDVFWKGKVDDPDRYPGANFSGGLGKDQLAFIERDLRLIPENQLVVLFMHIPLVSSWIEPERERLYRMLEKRPLVMSVAAHNHYQEHVWLTQDDGWQGPEPHHHVIAVTTCGSWWRGIPDERGIPVTTMRDGAPNGYLVATFDGTKYVMDFHAASASPNEQMHIWVPESISNESADSTATEFFVNVYNGSERSRVEFRLDTSDEWMPMERAAKVDPYYREAKAREKGDLPPLQKLPEPIPSPHLWSAKLPEELSAGLHLLHVRTVDLWGRMFELKRVIRVESARDRWRGADY
jgi:hypothetical protein